MQAELVTIDARVLYTTEHAYSIEYKEKDYWIPKSQVSNLKWHVQDKAKISMTYWIAKQKGIV